MLGEGISTIGHSLIYYNVHCSIFASHGKGQLEFNIEQSLQNIECNTFGFLYLVIDL